MIDNSSHLILKILDSALRDESVRENIDSISERVEQRLSISSDDFLAWESVPLSLYVEKLPETIRSSWVFVIRAHANTGAERHSNSRQFMMSYRGQGDLQIMKGDQWLSNKLVSDLEKKLEKRWVSVPPGTWHRVLTGEAPWTVVSFHTVDAEGLIEERPDARDTGIIRQRYYLNPCHGRGDDS
jgi:hypothetical protein